MFLIFINLGKITRIMKVQFNVGLCLILMGLANPQILLMGQLATYTHPICEFEFSASPGWEQCLYPDNGQVYRVVNPNRNMQIFLSFIPECDNPVKEMKKLSGRTGLICKQKPYDTIINDRQAFLLKGNCVQGRKPYRRLVLGIPGNNGLYVMEICCPEECYSSHRDEIYSLLGTVHTGA
jgi:hypothetical protein